MNLKRYVNYFLRGLLVVVPAGITIYFIYALVSWTDDLLPFDIPGLGLLTVLGIILSVGTVANTIIARPFFDLINKLFAKIPLINFIYTSINDLVTAFAGDKSRFDKPVLVPFDENGKLYKPGFITQSDMDKIGLEGMVTVYLPHSYNFSGNVFIVESSALKPLKGKSSDIMKYIVSGGVSGQIDLEQP